MSSLMEKPKLILKEIEAFVPKSIDELEQFRIQYIGSKGILKTLFAEIRNIPNEQKKIYGQLVNEVKQAAEKKINLFKQQLSKKDKHDKQQIDLSMPGPGNNPGSRHPISIIRQQIIDIFHHLGFTIAEGPEIEDDWHNFSALNLPPDHPARDMQDTFFIQKDPDIVLRTHTSPVQIRTMEKYDPPIKVISPGRVYRSDNDSTHSPVFNQVEGIYIDEKVSFAELKQTLYYFVKEMFGKNTELRFRPSFFPFTEPSAEMDIAWNKNGQKEWMEILGCGLVDPAVLSNCNIDPDQYTGYAFGMGVERIAMLKFGIRDIRLFYENDIRFLEQFSPAV